MTRFKLSLDEANAATSAFRAKLTRPLNLVWLSDSPFNEKDRVVAASLCEAHGADILTVALERTISLKLVNAGYKQTVCIEPSFRGVGEGEADTIVNAAMTLTVLGREVALNSVRRVVAVQLLVGVLGALSFAVFGGVFLYGLAVLIHFLVEPAALTMIATQKGSIGLALLCMLVGVAGIFGRAIRNVLSLAIKRTGRD